MLLKMETSSYNTDNILSDPFSSLATTEDDINQKTSSSSLGFMEMLGFQDYYFDNTTTYQQQLPPLPPPPTSSLSMAVEVHTSADDHNGDLGHDHMDNQDQFTTVDEESSVVLNGQPSSPNNSSSICTSPAHQRLNKQYIKEKKAMSGDEIKAKKKKKEKAPRFAFMTRTDIDHLDDGYRWRKYGQKAVKNSRFPRSYYRCTSASCNVKKRVERCMSDPSYVITTYEGQHNHPVALNSTPLIPSYNNYITNAAFAATAATTVTTPTPPAMLKLEQGGLLQDMLPCYHL
ncbi:putative transcription factor WRKY family [Helianthus annuus]|nr:putative transcription factor WRKY family [Helianthus annuus]